MARRRPPSPPRAAPPTPQKRAAAPPDRFPPTAPVPARPAPPPSKPSPRATWPLNLLSVVFLLGTVGVIALASLIWRDPYSPLNPLAPPTPLPVFITTTPLPPTTTPIPATATFTPLPRAALNALLPTATIAPPLYAPLGEVAYAENSNARACAWSSIEGQVLAADGTGVDGVRVQVQPVPDAPAAAPPPGDVVFTGAGTARGPGGFTLELGDAPTLRPFLVVVVTADGAPLSAPVYVVTSDQCAQNVAVVVFQATR